MNKSCKLFFIIIFTILFEQCATVRQTINPLENPLLSWIFDKSCISVDIPPITLTTEKTVLERQILGEKTELVPDGWIVLSPSYSFPFSSELLKNEEAIRFEWETILLYKSTLEFYIKKNYIGIHKNGDFLILPEKYRISTEKKHLEIVNPLIEIVNNSKNKIYEYLKSKEEALANQFLDEYNNTFQYMGWRYDEKQGWYK
ncbi:MAG: hypothetical protein ACK4UJ_06545 [Leptonema sp. (in: bacteria)]